MSPCRIVRNYQILMYNEHKKLKVVLDIICTSFIKIVGKMKVTHTHENSPFDFFPTLPRFSTLKNTTYQDWQENPSSTQYFKSVLYKSPVIHYLLHIIFFKIHINVVTN